MLLSLIPCLRLQITLFISIPLSRKDHESFAQLTRLVSQLVVLVVMGWLSVVAT